MVTLQGEIRQIIEEMKAKALESGDPDKERETTEIATIVLAQSLPEVTDDMPAALLSCHARSAVARAWMAYATKMLQTAHS
jgi:hypothetical protein